MRMVSASVIPAAPPPNEERLRSAADAPAPPTLGLEEELMLLHPSTLDLAPRVAEILAGLGGDPRFTLELPAAQIEIVVPPSRTVGEAVGTLARARSDLARQTAGEVALAGAGLHPFAAVEGDLNRRPRYDVTIAEDVARRQLVFALQVHVAIRGADRALVVHNALRSHLPELAALAANAPFHGGRDTGCASGRPAVSGLLPRQGIPPILASWAQYAQALALVRDPSRRARPGACAAARAAGRARAGRRAPRMPRGARVGAQARRRQRRDGDARGRGQRTRSAPRGRVARRQISSRVPSQRVRAAHADAAFPSRRRLRVAPRSPAFAGPCPPARPRAGGRRGPPPRAVPLLRAALPRPAWRARGLGMGAEPATAA
jgi:hypothetical protein